MPDAKLVWLYREELAKAGMVDELFAQSGGHLARRGYIARGGQILDVERAHATGSSAPARDRAGGAYRSAEIEAVVRARKLTSHIHRKGQRGKPLTGQAHNSNRTKSPVRVRVEHIFGAQANDMGAVLVRTSPTTCAVWLNWAA